MYVEGHDDVMLHIHYRIQRHVLAILTRKRNPPRVDWKVADNNLRKTKFLSSSSVGMIIYFRANLAEPPWFHLLFTTGYSSLGVGRVAQSV